MRAREELPATKRRRSMQNSSSRRTFTARQEREVAENSTCAWLKIILVAYSATANVVDKLVSVEKQTHPRMGHSPRIGEPASPSRTGRDKIEQQLFRSTVAEEARPVLLVLKNNNATEDDTATPFTSFAESLSPLSDVDMSSISGDKSWSVASETEIKNVAFGFNLAHEKTGYKMPTVKQEPGVEPSSQKDRVRARSREEEGGSRVSAKSAAAAVFQEMRRKKKEKAAKRGPGRKIKQQKPYKQYKPYKHQKPPLAAKSMGTGKPFKRGRGRPKKVKREVQQVKRPEPESATVPPPPKRKRGRPRKHPLPTVVVDTSTPVGRLVASHA